MTLRLSEIDKVEELLLEQCSAEFSHGFLTLLILILIMKISKETQAQFCLPHY